MILNLMSLNLESKSLLEEATKNRTEYQAPKTQEELEEFKTKYPDVFEVVETVAHMQSESKAKVLEERLSKLPTKRASYFDKMQKKG